MVSRKQHLGAGATNQYATRRLPPLESNSHNTVDRRGKAKQRKPIVGKGRRSCDGATKLAKRRRRHGLLDRDDLDLLRDKVTLRLHGLRTVQPFGQKLQIVQGRPESRELENRAVRVIDEIWSFKSQVPDPIKPFEFKQNNQHDRDFAANIIEAWWRTFWPMIIKKRAAEKRANESAIRIQAAARARHARKNVAQLRREKQRQQAGLVLTRVYRGYQGRELARKRRAYLARLALENLCATRIQTCYRRHLWQHEFQLKRNATTQIARAYRCFAARRIARNRRNAAQKIGEFALFVVHWNRYTRICIAALTIQLFWRRVMACRNVAARRAEVARVKHDEAMSKAALEMQRLFRGHLGRQSFMKQKNVHLVLEEAINSQEDIQLVVAHLVHRQNTERPRYLKDRYREAMMRFPDSSALRYGRALLAGVLEKDEDAARKSIADAKKLDFDGQGFLIIDRILGLASRRSKEDRALAHLHRALLLLWMESPQEQLAIDLLSQVTIKSSETFIVKLAERYLAIHEKEIDLGKFHTQCITDRTLQLQDRVGKLNVWKRGYNFRFQFSYTSTPNIAPEIPQPQAKRKLSSAIMRPRTIVLRSELVVRAFETRIYMNQLDRRDLLQSGLETELATKLESMLDIVESKTHGEAAHLYIKFTQEPFPKMTVHIQSKNTLLSVIAFSADANAEHILDVVLHARDNVLEEEYRLLVSDQEIRALFADNHLLLAARQKPGWRIKCRTLISKLVEMLDLEENAVPNVGDWVISVDPKYKHHMENAVSQAIAKKVPRWYRCGKVLERIGLRFRIEPWAERRPQGSLYFQPASQHGKSVAEKKEYWLDLVDIRLARTRWDPNLEIEELIAPRVRINEPPELSKPFRLEKQRRKLVLRGAERKQQAKSNIAALHVQRLYRGIKGRQEAWRVYQDQCATQIANAWRWKVLLMRRVKMRAQEYREIQACIRVQAFARKALARKQFRARLLYCFGPISLSQAMNHLTFQRQYGSLSLADQGLAMLAFELVTQYDKLPDICEFFKEALEREPRHPDIRVGYAISHVQLAWCLLGELETDPRDLKHFQFDETCRSAFSVSFRLYLERIARLWCDNPFCILHLSIVQRLLFFDYDAAYDAAKQALTLYQRRCSRTPLMELDLSSKDQRENVLRLNFASCCLRRLRGHLASRRITQWFRVYKKQSAFNLSPESCLNWRLANGDEYEAWVRFAWYLHICCSCSDRNKVRKAYGKALLAAQSRGQKSVVSCSLALYELQANCAIAQDEVRDLFEQDGNRFLRSGFRDITNYQLTMTTQSHLLFIAALLDWYIDRNSTACFEKLHQCLTLEPTNIEMNIRCSELRCAVANGPVLLRKKSTLIIHPERVSISEVPNQMKESPDRDPSRHEEEVEEKQVFED